MPRRRLRIREMTKEEAIEQLLDVKRGYDSLSEEAIYMAIEALEQEPKTGHWIMKRRTHNEVKHYTGQDEMGEIHTISVLERYEVDEPYCSECGKRAGDTSQDYCCACGAKMVESEEKE